MSFLSSIISTIDGSGGGAGDGRKIPTPAAVVARDRGTPASSRDTTTQEHLKRKSQGLDKEQTLKIPKVSSAATSVHSPSRGSTSSPVPRAPSTLPKPASTGTASARPTVKSGLQRPLSVQSTGTNDKPAAGTTPVQQKKGGYLAMLERAKVQQEATKPVGQIKHHKVEKIRISRREKERLAAEAKAKSASSAIKSIGQARPRGPVAAPSFNAPPSKPKVETSYKGTMRPAAKEQPAYRGTIGNGTSSSKPGQYNNKAKSKLSGTSRYRYAEDYDDDDEDEDEDMNDYDSASSDMEAGMDDIDEEELMSAKVARKEDEEALREENELKRMKLERKRKLQALSSAAAAKKKVY